MFDFLPDLIPAMARASRQKAVRRFDVEIVTRAMAEILVGHTIPENSQPVTAAPVDSGGPLLSNRRQADGSHNEACEQREDDVE